MQQTSFSQRFSFARWWQGVVSGEETDREFAAATGFSTASVSAWRQAPSAPPWTTCKAIAERTGVDAVWLIEGSGEEPELFARYVKANGIAPAKRAAVKLKAEDLAVVQRRPPKKKAANDRGQGDKRR